jgi:tRNA threonylcarbamoyl adenosine modification protein YjeE
MSPSLWKAASGYSEKELNHLATDLAHELEPGDRVLLEGPLGAGKTTFARSLLLGLGVIQPPEGSPTFAIAHEYESENGGVVHIDFYRLRSENEIEEAGISTYYWERKLIVIAEWLSLWPEYQEQVIRSGRTWRVTIGFESNELNRTVWVERLQT